MNYRESSQEFTLLKDQSFTKTANLRFNKLTYVFPEMTKKQ